MSTLSVGTIKSATTSPPTIQNSAGTQIGTFCRAWVNFNGTFGTSPFTIANGGIRAAFNVSSITDNGTGVYTVNFTTAMPDSNYSVVASAKIDDNSTSGTQTLNACSYGRTTTFSPLMVQRPDDALRDGAIVCVAIFR